jgi:hypothetical protein
MPVDVILVVDKILCLCPYPLGQIKYVAVVAVFSLPPSFILTLDFLVWPLIRAL